jgi:hypothetical protein
VIRLASLSLLVVVAVVVVGRLIAPDADVASSKGSRPESRAVAAVSKRLSKLPADRAIRCKRSRRSRRRTRRFSCRWRAGRRLSPNRTLRCHGGSTVKLSRRRASVRSRRRTRCSVDVRALDPRFGFHDNSVAGGRASPEEVARLTEGTGAGIYRVLIDWRSTEPARHVFDFGLADRVYKAMRARGIRPLFVLAWAPSWAWGAGQLCSGDQCHFPPGTSFDGDWQDMAGRLAKRYPEAAGIEIWNEPNESTAWNWKADPARYVELLHEAHTAIKASDPSMPVISGGLSNRQDSGGGSMSLGDFARQMFARGGGQYMDGFGIHPYVPKDLSEGFGKTLDLARSLRPGQLPIWVTEVGETTSGPADDPFHVSEDDQANMDVTAYRAFHSQPDVKAVLIHTLIDPYDDPGDPQSGYGVVRKDLSEKPAYCALARETGARSQCP